jgi:chorismate synthase
VPAAAVVAEAMVALVLADAVVERYGGDNMVDLHHAVDAATESLKARFQPR